MSQKTILSFFKQAPTPNSASVSTVDDEGEKPKKGRKEEPKKVKKEEHKKVKKEEPKKVKKGEPKKMKKEEPKKEKKEEPKKVKKEEPKKVEEEKSKKVKKEECYDDSPVKQQKKRKRIKNIIDSDEEEPNSSDEAEEKTSNSPTMVKENQTRNGEEKQVNGDSNTEPKAKKPKIKSSPISSKSEKSLTNGSSEEQAESKKPTQVLSDEEENTTDIKEKGKDDEEGKRNKDIASNGIISEDDMVANKSDVVSQNTTVDFIPKRKTARKQMRGGQRLKEITSKRVENPTALDTKSESTVETAMNGESKLDSNKSTNTNVSDSEDEKMEVDKTDDDQEICSKNTEESKDENSPSRKKEKRGVNKASPTSNRKSNTKPNKEVQSPETVKNLENSDSDKEDKHSKNSDSDQNKDDTNNLSSSEDEIPNKESLKTEESPSSSKKPAIHPFFKKKNESVSPQKDDSTKKVNKTLQSSSSGGVYNPSKNHYHPIDDACWKRSEKVPYLALAKTLELIENTSARLQMIEILSNFLRSVMVLTPEDLLNCVYLCLNRLAPEYEGIELGVGEMLLMKAVAQATGRTVEKIKAEVAVKGDLGLVAENSRGNQRVMFAPPKLTVSSVFTKFKEIAKMSGNTVMAKKTDKIQSLFVACRDCEAKYIIRSLSGKLRIGLAEQSVLAALARAAVMTPPNQSYPPEVIDKSSKMSADKFKKYLNDQSLILKTTYCECPNFDLVIPVLLKEGIEGLPEHCQLSPGCPLKPMLAHPTNGIDEVLNRFDKNEFTCEYKYDGERAQIHMKDTGEVKIFSRNQEDNTSKYPDIISRITKALKDSIKTFILDTEAVAWDCETKQILPFQVLSTRKKKDAVESDIKVHVCVMAFDLLYLNGESLVKKTLKERRDLLHSSFVEIPNEFMFVNYRDGDSADTMQEFLDESVKGNCEGLMVKALTVDASYEIAKRSHNWLKLKKDYLKGVGDTLDLVVIGGYHGKGKRTGTYGGFLLACYDEENEEFQSICKLGTGFSEEELNTHTKFLKEHVIKEPKSYYRYDSSLEPDEWFEPVQIWEIKCADLSISPVHKAALGIVDPEKGISLRFPRFLRIRDDKTKPEDCTGATQIAEMYQNQEQVQNTKGKNVKLEEDFY